MDVDQLRAFVAVARAGRFTRAARQLGTSQPNLSRRLQQLERQVAAKLVVRTPVGVVLTSAGERFLSYAESAIAAVDAGRTALDELGGQPRGAVALGSQPTIGAYALPEALARFHAEQPGILLRLREGPLLFISFCGAKTQPGKQDMMITDASGKERAVAGIYAALSFDEGETWPTRRLISDDGPAREMETTDRRVFTMSASSAENFGYLAIVQGANGVIHLISSKNHYSFNLAWAKTPAPAL